MKLKLIFVMTLLLVIASCSRDHEIETPQEIITDKPNEISFIFPILAPSGGEYNYNFEYDSLGRISKRIGIYIEWDMQWIEHLSKYGYTKITYTGNTAMMKNYNASKPDERKFEFDNQGRVIKLIIPSPTNEAAKEKRITYSYNNSGKLAEALTEFPNALYDPTNPNDYVLAYVEKFIYNNKGNLEKAITTEKHNNIEAYITKEIEFEFFDLVPNPFRKLGIFEDYFYFSLSTNNYNKITTKFYKLGKLDKTVSRVWAHSYNSDGTLKLFK